MKRGIAYPLFSGGLDSTILTLDAINQYEEVKPIFFNRGQTALYNERKAVKNISEKGSFNDKIINLNVGLTWNRPDGFPCRNMILMLIAASYIESNYDNYSTVLLGFNSDDTEDTSKEIIDILNKGISEGVRNNKEDARIRFEAPYIDLTKMNLLDYGISKGFNDYFELTWSCWKDGRNFGDKPCGKCYACESREKIGI